MHGKNAQTTTSWQKRFKLHYQQHKKMEKNATNNHVTTETKLINLLKTSKNEKNGQTTMLQQNQKNVNLQKN